MRQIGKRHFAGGLSIFLSGVAMGRALQVDRQVTSYRRAWEDHNLSTLRWLRRTTENAESEKPYLIVALGDSATQGVGAKRIAEGYVPLLAASISSVLDRPVALLNLSVSGGTLETVLVHQIPLLRGLGLLDDGYWPELVVGNVGGNDVGVTTITAELFRSYARELAEQLPPGTLFGNIPSFSLLAAEERAEELSWILDQEVTKRGHLPVDLRKLTLSYRPIEYLIGYHAADLFHPNSRAYAQWGDLFFGQWLKTHGPVPGPGVNPEWKMRSVRGEFAATREAMNDE